MLSIFQTETTALESQVAALQAQLATAQGRISLLNETELLAGGTLEALKDAIDKVSALAPTAIASLKLAVLNLFSGDKSDDGNGNQPINPAPQPQSAAPQPEPLTGQLCELTSPWYHPPADAAHVELDTGCTVSDAQRPEPEQLPYVELIPVSHCVAYQRRENGEIICCYLAGNNKSRLQDWGSWLCNQHSVGSGFELRVAKRMTAYKYELKIWGMSLKQLKRLAETGTTKTPPSRYHVASFPVAAHLLACDEVSAPQTSRCAEVTDRDVEESIMTEVKLEQDALPDPQGFQVGDRVEVISDRHGVELVGLTGIVTAGTAAGAAVDVNNILRYFCVDELATVSTPVSPATQQPTEEEKIARASIQPPFSYNPYPQGRRGAMKNWEAYQAAKAVEREQKVNAKVAVIDSPQMTSPEQVIASGDWVELLVNGDRYQVDSVDSEGVHLTTDDGNMCVQSDEVTLQFKLTVGWKPF